MIYEKNITSETFKTVDGVDVCNALCEIIRRSQFGTNFNHTKDNFFVEQLDDGTVKVLFGKLKSNDRTISIILTTTMERDDDAWTVEFMRDTQHVMDITIDSAELLAEDHTQIYDDFKPVFVMM